MSAWVEAHLEPVVGMPAAASSSGDISRALNQSPEAGPWVGGGRSLMTGDKRPVAATGQFLGRVDMAAFERISRLCKFTSPRNCRGGISERFV